MICIRLSAPESRDIVINLDDDRLKSDPAVITVRATISRQEIASIRDKLGIKASNTQQQDIFLESTWVHP